MILAVAAFAHLAASCGPSVHPDTLAAIAKSESRFDTLAIYDNRKKQRIEAKSFAEAVMIAIDLIEKGHSLDLGIMQVNSGNLARLHLTVRNAFDPCASIEAGAQMLAENYKAPDPGMASNAAIDDALSRYNTGDAVRGFQNGYVAKVNESAAQVVPALHPETAYSPATPPAQIPPTWNVYGNAEYARRHSNTTFGASNYQPGQSATATASVGSPSTTPTVERN